MKTYKSAVLSSESRSQAGLDYAESRKTSFQQKNRLSVVFVGYS